MNKHNSVLMLCLLLLSMMLGFSFVPTPQPTESLGSTPTEVVVGTSKAEHSESVEYSLSTGMDEQLVTSHSVIPTGLEPDSSDHLGVRSEDATANEAASEDDLFLTVQDTRGVIGRWPYGSCNTVLADGAYVYVGSGGVIIIVDMTNPSTPLEMSRIATPGAVLGLFRSGDYLYVADKFGGLRIMSAAKLFERRLARLNRSSGKQREALAGLSLG